MKEARLFHNLAKVLRGVEQVSLLDDPQVFNDFYEQNYRSVYRYLYGLQGGAVEDIEDLTAETFTHAWKARQTFRGDPQTAGIGWLLGIARRLVIDAYRRSRARIQPEDTLPEDLPQLGPAPESLVLLGEQYEILWALLQGLTVEQREMLVLRYMLDWHIYQISAYLDIPENTVSVTIRRALARLQRDWPQGKV